MSKTERVLAALRGDEVDRVPVSAWWHDFAREWSAQGLADATLEAYRRYDWDFVKVNPRATYYAEDWGAEYKQSDQPFQRPDLMRPAVSSARDLRRIGPLNVTMGAYGQQLDALSLIAGALRDEAPVIQTVFSPLAVMSRLTGSTSRVRELMQEAPEDLIGALGPISETLAGYASSCVARGAAGVFFATVEWGSADSISAEDYDRFARPFDLTVLDAVADAPFDVFHVCRDNNHLERLLDYPVHAFHWASRSSSNPSLADILSGTDKAVMGGVDHGHTIQQAGPPDVTAEAKEALSSTGGRRFLLAPECSIEPQTPPQNILAMLEAVRA